jgi:hypothetical protein
MRNKQIGAGLVGWLIVLSLIGLVALVTIRLAPVYMESFTVSSVLKGLAGDNSLKGTDRAQVLQALTKRLEVNNVGSIKRENVKLETVSGGLQVTVAYEKRFPILGNLDGIADFREQALIRD